MVKFYTDPEDFVNNKLNCNAWVATAIVGAAAISGAVRAYSANSAANAQSGAANQANTTLREGALRGQNALEYYNNIAQNYLDPYRQLGQNAIGNLSSRFDDLTKALPVSQEQLDLQKPLNIDQNTLENLPGYQFARTQGLKATQNSAAARGLGVSGAALKGAATFSQGLADQNFNNYFQTEMANRQSAFGRYQTTWQDTLQGQQSAYDRLMGVIGAGENASGVSGALSQRTGQGIASTLTDAARGVSGNIVGSGNAQAAGINATGQAVSDVANSVPGAVWQYNNPYSGLYGRNAPNLSYVQGIAGDQRVPTFG